MQYALMRSMRFSVMRREDAYGFSRRGKGGGGLNRSYACPTQHFDSRGPSKNRPLFNVLNDNACPTPKRCAAGALTRMSSVPEVKPPSRKTAMSSNFKVRRFRTHELWHWQWRRRQSRPGPAPARLRRRRNGQFVQHGQGLQFPSQCQFACQPLVEGLVYASAPFFGHGIPPRGSGFKD